MIPAPPRQHSLLRFAEVEISGTLWEEYRQVMDAGPAALAKSALLDDPLQDLGKIPYDDPAGAERHLRRRRVERLLADEICIRAAAGEWRVEGREDDAVEFAVLDPRILRQARFDFERNAISVEGRYYVDISLAAVIPDQQKEVERVIRVLEPRFDPKSHRIQDLKLAVEEVLGRDVPLTYFLDTMKRAGSSPHWNDKGRRPGSPSHPKKK